MDRLAVFLGAKDADGKNEAKNLGPLLLVHANICFYALCYWIQEPVLPYLSQELGADAVQFGYLQSCVSGMALLGGASMGRITDTRGARVSLIIAQGGGVIMYALMAMSTSLPLLFASRIPAAVQHCMMCGQASVSQLTSAKNRAHAMGKLALSYGVGMVIGSPIGGFLSSSLGYKGAAAVACGLSVIIVVLDTLYLPPLKSEALAKAETKAEPAKSNLAEVWRVLMVKPVRDILIIMTIISVGAGSYQAMFPLAAKKVFKMESKDMGMFFSYAAIVGLLTNIFLVKPATDYLGQFKTVVGSALLLAVCYLGFANLTEFNHLLLLTIPSTIASTLLYTFASSMMSMAVSSEDSGTAIAMSHNSRSLCGIVAPVIGGVVFARGSVPGLGMFGSLMCVLACVYVVFVAKPTLLELERKAATNAAEKASKGS